MARGFQFSLEQVLEYRRQMEDQAALALAKAKKAYMLQTEKVESLRAELARAEAELSGKSTLSVPEMRLWMDFREGLQADLQTAETRLLKLARELSQARQAAVLKRKERKILEELKEKKRLLHVKSEDHKEQKEFDEMATVRRRPETV